MISTLDEIFESPKRRRPKWPRWVGLTVVILAVIAAAGWGADKLLYACGGLNSGVTKIDGECVGVTDGSYHFDPALASIEDQIAAENRRVQDSGHTVTIALLNPLTANSTSALDIDQIRKELEGAYTAQIYANQQGNLGDAHPLIRLVLANEGSHENQWQPVVEQLKGMVGEQPPLVAVTGLGLSTPQTELGAKELAAHGIPMIGAINTADELNYKNIHGFIRVAPSNQDYVQSLQRYLKDRPELNSAILVYDGNSDQPGNPDLFTRSLRDDLVSGMQHVIKFPTRSFTGASGQSPARPDLFDNIIHDICSSPGPNVVLYAGRSIDIFSFLDSLKGRGCNNAPITVVTGGTDLGALKKNENELQDSNITVAYAAASDPNGWANNVSGTPPHFPEFLSRFRFGFADLDDGGAIANYDAVLAAVRAIRLAVPSSSSSQDIPTAADVLSQLLNMSGQDTVPGASGDLIFSHRGDESGNPSNKPIPVLEIPSSGSFAVEAGKTYFTGATP